MTNSSELLVLIANEKQASICVMCDGATRTLRSIDRVFHAQNVRDDAQTAALADRNKYACELMMALGRDARDRDYDGVVIFSDALMTDDLRKVRTGIISRLLIAQFLGTPGDCLPIPHDRIVHTAPIVRGTLQ